MLTRIFDIDTGYIGRFLALHIHKNHLASEVRLVDKVLPQLAWLAPEFEEACSQDKFMQADASKERMSGPPTVLIPHLLRKTWRRPPNANGPPPQNPSRASSTAQTASNSTTSSTAAAKRATRKRTKCTASAPSTFPSRRGGKPRNGR
jgi:nucleoside-diphosphate-sugar epimerase